MLVDLTVALEPVMPTLDGLPGFEPERLATYEESGNLVSAFSTNTHQGTHVDAPAHYVEGGTTVDEIPLEALVGTADVVDLREYAGEPITAEILESETDGFETSRVVLVTGDMDDGFTSPDFYETAAHITTSGATWLVDEGVDFLANDFLTEAFGDSDRPVHNTLLEAGMPIVEYIHNTAAIAAADTVEFTCLPLAIPTFEAAPARAYARL